MNSLSLVRVSDVFTVASMAATDCEKRGLGIRKHDGKITISLMVSIATLTVE